MQKAETTEKRTRSRKEKICSALLIFAVCLLSFFLTNFAALFKTALDPQTIKGALLRSDYYENLTAEVKNTLYDYGDVSGVPHSVFDQIVTVSLVTQDSHAYFDRCLSGLGGAVDTAAFRKALRQSLDAYNNQKGYTEETVPGLQKNVNAFISACADVYEKGVEITILPATGRLLKRLNTASAVILAGLCLLLAAYVFRLYRMHKWKHRFFREMVYAMSGDVLMVLVIPATLTLLHTAERMGIGAKSLYLFFVQVCRDYMAALWFGAGAAAVAVVLLLLAYLYSRGAFVRVPGFGRKETW